MKVDAVGGGTQAEAERAGVPASGGMKEEETEEERCPAAMWAETDLKSGSE